MPPSAPAAERLNIVFFLVDDLGWADVGCNGSTFHQTPHIDRLAAAGMRFTDAYTGGSVCSPTRASLMTGKHPVRVNITDWIPGCGVPKNKPLIVPDDEDHLALEETTLAEALKDGGGYRTFYAGKWHLGGEPYAPDKQGFDVYFDPHGDPAKGSPAKLKPGQVRPHDTRGITREALRFLDDNHGKAPMFLYLAFYDVHTPIVADDETLADYRARAKDLGPSPKPIKEGSGVSRPRQDGAAYGSMVSIVDWSVGQVTAKLESLGIADDTAIVFFSDNGGLCTLGNRPGPTSNAPLRSGKGWLYEGGIRAPLIVKAPGVKPGATTAAPAVSMDLYPTLLAIAGLPPRPDQHLDGISLMPALKGEPMPADRTLYWHYPHYHGSAWKPGAAMRAGDWKLIEFYEEERAELYRLSDDLGEQHDLAKAEPAKLAEMRQKLRDWQAAMGARLPTKRQ
ncbi:MAG: sulfatase [Verrucomicrobiales bacterium]